MLYHVTSAADFMLIVSVPSMSAYEALTRGLFPGNHIVTQFQALVATDPHQGQPCVPLRSD